MNMQVRPVQAGLVQPSDFGHEPAHKPSPDAPSTGAPSAEISARLKALDTAARARFEPGAANDAGNSSPRALFEQRFAALAGDPTAFHALLREVYGKGYDAQTAEVLRERALSGDFDWLPKVHFVGENVLGSANGAYDAASDTVYLAARLQGGKLAAETFVEEAGHALDVRLNGTRDTAGDEGELFRRLLGGEALSAEDKAAIRAEDDTGTIVVDGHKREVEFWNPLKKAARWVKKNVVDPVVNFVDQKIIDPVAQILPEPIRKHVIEPLRGFARTTIDMGWNGLETLVDVGSTVLAAPYQIGRELLRGDLRGAWDAALDAGKTVLKESAGFVVESGALLLHRTSDILNGVLGLAETRTLDELLSPEQRQQLESIYGNSIDYDAIRVQQGGIEKWLGMSPHAVGNDIYLPDSAFDANGNLVGIDLLSHELAHAWQFQNGGAGYLSEAIASYVSPGREEAYDYLTALDQQRPFDEMTPDQQAEFAMLIGMAIVRDPSGELTPQGIQEAIFDDTRGSATRVISADELAYFQAIHQRLLNGDALPR